MSYSAGQAHAGLLRLDPPHPLRMQACCRMILSCSIADALERSLGLPVVRDSEKKPAGSAASLERQLSLPLRKHPDLVDPRCPWDTMLSEV